MKCTEKIAHIKTVGRAADAMQIFVLTTMGLYIHGGGNQQLSSKHWAPVRDFMGGYENVGLSLMVIAFFGFLGLAALVISTSVRPYNVVMTVFTILAASWFWFIGIWHGWAAATIPGAASTGLWTLGLAGMFFVFSRVVIWIANRSEV